MELLTIEDLRNPARKSGFNHVRKDFRCNRYEAQVVDRSGMPNFHGGYRQTAEEAAQNYCDLINGLEVAPATKVERRRKWHRPDFNDLGASAGKFRGGKRGEAHRAFATKLSKAGKLGPYDDVKLETVTPRDLLGTTACMFIDAHENNHEIGRILVPAPISKDLVIWAWNLHSVRVVVVRVKLP